MAVIMNGCAVTNSGSVAPNAAVQKPSATSKTQKWAIGQGSERKVFDHEPSVEELRQWRYETILATAGLQYANEYMRQELQLDAMKRRAEREKLELEQMRRDNAGAAQQKSRAQ